MDVVVKAIIEIMVFLGTITIALHAAQREDRAALHGSSGQEPAP
jgi:hypothetical protein